VGEDDEFECPNCRVIDCFYKKLKLTDEELKKVKELEKDPEKVIEYLSSIRSDDELKEAWRSCSL